MTDRSVAEARERLYSDYFCEHPEGDAARARGEVCVECIAIYDAAVRADERRVMRERVEALGGTRTAPRLPYRVLLDRAAVLTALGSAE